MIDGNIDVLSLEGQIVDSISLEGDLLPIGPKGDKGDPGFSPVVTTSKSGKTTTIKFETATGNVYAYIQDGEDGQGSGDMLTDVYDKNKNGIVDDAEKVNGKTVLSNVPANAVFTDTIYDDTEVRSLINAKPDFSDIPTNVSELENDANYVSSDGDSTISGENTELSLSGTTEGMFKTLDLKGNTSQKTLSGKNLFDTSKIQYTNNWNTLDVKFTDGIIKFNGSNNTAGAIVGRYVRNGFVLPAGTYTISWRKIRGSFNAGNNSTSLYLRKYSTTPDQDVLIFAKNIKNINDGDMVKQFTLSQDTEVSFEIYTNGAITYNNFVVSMQIEEGTIATEFEEYCGGIPSPNPNYPQDVNNVSGDNEIVVCGKNLFDERITTGRWSFTVGSVITPNTSAGYRNVNGISIYPNTNYTISFDVNVAGGYIVETDSSNKVLAINNGDGYKEIPFSSRHSSLSFTSHPEARYLYWYIANSYAIEPKNCMLEYGTNETSYEPYTCSTYNIDLPVENLLPVSDITNSSVLTNNGDGTLTLNGRGNGGTNYQLTTPIILKANKPYSLSLTQYSSEITIALRTDTTTNVIAASSSYETLTPANDITINYIRVFTDGNTTFNDFTFSIQLEQNETPNSYTPYGTTPIELNKIGTYQDYFYKQDDKWYLHKEVGKVVLNGSESWNLNETNTNTMRFVVEGEIINALNTSTDNFKNNMFSEYIGNAGINSIDSEGIAIRDLKNGITIRANKSRVSNLSGFKNWLSTNNVIVNYVLEKPTNTEITDTTLISQLNALYKAYTYKNQTNISQSNNDLPFILNVEAFTDTYNGRYENIINMIKKVQ